jgi:hypothetical protein
VEREDDRIEVELLPPEGDDRGARAWPALSARLRVAGPTVTATRDLIGGSLLERYVGYDGDPPRRTLVEHSPWVIQRLDVESLRSHGLVSDDARLAAAHFGTPRVVAVGIPHGVGVPEPQPVAEPV